jgi:MFS family permease
VTDTAATEHWKRNLLVSAAGSFTTVAGITLILPILPLFVEDFGVRSTAAVTTWSGIAYSATFLSAALTAPLWGYLGDRYGRKAMLIRASLGMAIAMSLIGLAQNVWQLVALRLLAGLLGGYASGSTILVAAQTPKERSAWALGVLSSAIMAGNIAGPLLGGGLAEAFGVTTAFFAVGALRRHRSPSQGGETRAIGRATEGERRLARRARQADDPRAARSLGGPHVRDDLCRADHHRPRRTAHRHR